MRPCLAQVGVQVPVGRADWRQISPRLTGGEKHIAPMLTWLSGLSLAAQAALASLLVGLALAGLVRAWRTAVR